MDSQGARRSALRALCRRTQRAVRDRDPFCRMRNPISWGQRTTVVETRWPSNCSKRYRVCEVVVMVVSAIILGFIIFGLFLSMLGSSPKREEPSEDAILLA